jgi:hypothetical protein
MTKKMPKKIPASQRLHVTVYNDSAESDYTCIDVDNPCVEAKFDCKKSELAKRLEEYVLDSGGDIKELDIDKLFAECAEEGGDGTARLPHDLFGGWWHAVRLELA